MITMLILVALVGWGTVLRRRCRWAPEVIPLALFASIIVALFLFGLAGSLRAGAWVLIGSGALGGLLEWRASRWQLPRVSGWRPGIVIFVAVSAAAVWRLQGAALWDIDEFSHWGLIAKVIIATGELTTADSPVYLRDYPPGSALFYFFLTFGREYSEWLLYAAHAVLAFAAAAAICVGSGWLATTVAFAAVYFGLFAFAGGLQVLRVDAIVALFFGAALAGYFRHDSHDRAWVIPVLLALPLLKSVGLMLALFAALVIACDQLFAGTPWRRRVAFVLILAAAPLVISGVWRLRMRAVDAEPTFRVPVSRSAGGFTAVRETPRGQLTLRRFQRALTASPVNPPWADTPEHRVAQEKAGRPTPPLSVARCTWLFALLAVLAAVTQRDWAQQRRVLLASGVLLACAGVYAAGLLVLYVNSFSEYEGTRLASFGRYFGMLFLGLTLVVLAWFLAAWQTNGWRRLAAAMLTCLFTAGLAFIATPDSRDFPRSGPRRLSQERRQIQELLRTVKASPQAERVYLVWQGTQGYEFHQSRYELAPRHTNKTCWSVGPPTPGDVWTCPLSVSAWATLLQRYDSVVLGRVDSRFFQSFGKLFVGQLNSRTFAVARNTPSGPVSLTAVIDAAEREARAARDRQRVADLQVLQRALESYIASHGPLPSPASYGEAARAPDFWDRWWDLSAVDGNGNGTPFLDFLVERGVIQTVPVDPFNVTIEPTNPQEGQQFVYLAVPPHYDYAGGPCGPPTRGHYLLAITDLESELSRPPTIASGSGCACLWRDRANFFQQFFDYVLCGSFDMTPVSRPVR